jgi:tetratricopeptide (TPR) repeat protein
MMPSNQQTRNSSLALGRKYHRAGALDKAEQIYREILDREPDNADALCLLGALVGQSGQKDLALLYVTRARGGDPAHPKSLCHLGTAYEAIGRLDQASLSYREALLLKPDFAEAYYHLGTVLHKSGTFEEAANCYREALKVQPDYPEADGRLGFLLLRQQRFEEALLCFRRAVAQRPEWPEAQLNLGVALARQGQLEEAANAFRSALRLKPDWAEARRNLELATRQQRRSIAPSRTSTVEPASPVAPAKAPARPVEAEPEALHQKGLSLLHQGKAEEAANCFRQALARKPQWPEALHNLANALRDGGRYDESSAFYREALRLKPEFAEAHHSFGLALAAQRKFAEAEAHYRESLRLKPQFAEALNNLGLVLKELGKLDEALSSYQESLRLKPNCLAVYNNLANLYAEQGKEAEAVAAYQEALRLKPDYPEVLNNLGNLLGGQGKLDEAIASYRQALHFRPNYPEVCNNLGNALAAQGKTDEALASYGEAIRLKPDYAEGHNNLANLQANYGSLEEGLLGYEEALRLKPDFVDAHLNRSLAWLRMGDYARGLPEYEWRWQGKGRAQRSCAQPLWDGSPLAGRIILLYPEQGIGDTIQFARYAPLLKEQGATVLLETPAALLRLFAGLPGVDQLLAPGMVIPKFDVHAPLMSLPRLVSTTVDTIPARVPYLHAEESLLKEWGQRLKSDGYRVGIVWQGNPKYAGDRNRSVRLRQFGPLAQVPGIELVSLQKGPGREQLVEEAGCFAVRDVLGESEVDFSDTAAIIRNLDLVIAVDTAVAHLAGALAVPVWVAIPFASDWRWLRGREDSPWYPTMRLFRQRQRGDWEDVFQRMAEALGKRLEGISSATRPLPSPEMVAQAEALHEEGLGYVGDERWEQAIACFRRALEIKSHWPEAEHNLGVALAKQGQLDEATEHFHHVLWLKPDWAEAHASLGLASLQQNRLDEAVQAYRQAVAFDPASAAAHNNLGVVLGRLEKWDEAASRYRRALELDPNFFYAHNNLGNALRHLGRLEEAVECLRRALQIRADSADGRYNLGLVYQQQGRLDDAVNLFVEAIRLQPQTAELYHSLGFALQQQERFAEAVTNYQKALELQPNYAEALHNLGSALVRLGDFQAAEAALRRALEVTPDSAGVHNSLGIALSEQGELDQAVAAYRRALEIDPAHLNARINLGTALADLDEPEEALKEYEQALADHPQSPMAHLQRALVWLRTGDFARGLWEFEWRWQAAGRSPRSYAQPPWDGSSLAGKTILLYPEQGLGDTIQFIRYAHDLKEQGARVLLESPPSLSRLLASCRAVDRVLKPGTTLPAFDVHAPLLNLPRLLGTTRDTIPAHVPYLHVDEQLSQKWRKRLGDGPFRVGIAWQGDSTAVNSRQRSVPLGAFEPLAQIPGIELVSLQKRTDCEQLTEIEGHFAVREVLADVEMDAAEMAALIANLDLVVTVDNEIAHVAGALGLPVWLALSCSADWRWFREDDHSPWYPTMRLFRQGSRGRWDDVFQAIADELARQDSPNH